MTDPTADRQSTAAGGAAAKRQAATDATHYELAEQWMMSRVAHGAHFPIFNGGSFYTPSKAQTWKPLSMGKVEAEVAALFVGEKLARKHSDYRGIAATAVNLADDPEFFAAAPMGVASPAGFHRIGPDGAITTEPLTLAHRQTFALSCAPDSEVEPVLTDRMLADALDGPDAAEQIELAWQIVGAALFGLMARHQVAGLFLGAPGSGKSTFQMLLRGLFPADAVSAVPPSSWGREYFVASLAGKRLNLVGELDDAAPIPAAAFKNITGGGLAEGRHPTHRPFSFVCVAAHCFASNTLPATTDKGEGFFRRWRVVHFRHRVPDAAVDPYLVDKIIAHEMPGVIARAFAAAESVAKAGGLRVTPSHSAAMDKWRNAANPIIQWLTDVDAIELDPQARDTTTTQAYEHYRRWAADAGFRHAFGRNHFLDLLETTGPARGVRLTRTNEGRMVAGLALKPLRFPG
ncbi:MAG: hypothetical protein IPI51_22505 [Betaproteobacteria bacterium]|jgi:putative DNA primase/helicase|nr:hypothetical protein [Betaproteobacteria bacterium]MBK7518297.1 hypothetical protein [Betaproteobacteria bacterium]